MIAVLTPGDPDGNEASDDDATFVSAGLYVEGSAVYVYVYLIVLNVSGRNLRSVKFIPFVTLPLSSSRLAHDAACCSISG
jgi:hypothetical protein